MCGFAFVCPIETTIIISYPHHKLPIARPSFKTPHAHSRASITMASLTLDKNDFAQVHAAPAVLTPFEEDTHDPVLSLDADVPVPSIERDHDAFIFGPPSQSSEGRYTTSRYTTSRSSPRRLSDHTQLTEPSSISDMPSESFSLAQHKPKGAFHPSASSATALSSPAISPTKERQPFFDSHDASRHQTLKPKRPSPHRRHHTTTTHSTPTRSPLHQTPSSRLQPQPQQSQPPLILLHITLLPPSAPPLPLRVMPPALQAQYRLLEDKLADAVLMQRGLLVPHPRDEYDVLEERLLEALGLVAPRVLKCGHFRGSDDDEQARGRRDSGVEPEASRAGVEEEVDEEETCEECHAPVADGDPARAAPPHASWSIRIYAANGLMRAGAWQAAWSEMERVDVEVAPWIGKAQLRKMERRLEDEERKRYEEEVRADEERRQEIAEAEERVRVEAEEEAEVRLARAAKVAEEEKLRLIGSAALSAAAERRMADERVKDAVKEERRRVREEAARKRAERAAAKKDIPLGVLLRNSIYVVATDPRNILILLLSVLVGFLSLQSVAPSELPSTELDITPFDMPIVENSTIPLLPLEVVHTSTTTLTAFILQTISPQASVIATAETDRPVSETEPSTTSSPTAEPTTSPDAETALKDAIFAATVQILDSAFDKMAAIVSAAQTEASGTPQDEAAEEAIIMPVSPDGVDHQAPSTGENEGDDKVPAAPVQVVEHATPKPLDIGESMAHPSESVSPLDAHPATTKAVEDVTWIPDDEPVMVEERRESTATVVSMDVPIHLDAEDDGHQTWLHRAHPAELFAIAHPVCHAQDEDQGEDEPMLEVDYLAKQQSTSCRPQLGYFHYKPICPAVAVEQEKNASVDLDDHEDDPTEAFMEAIVFEESERESVGKESLSQERHHQDLVLEQIDGTESAEIVVQLPRDVESPVEASTEKILELEEEIAVVLDV